MNVVILENLILFSCFFSVLAGFDVFLSKITPIRYFCVLLQKYRIDVWFRIHIIASPPALQKSSRFYSIVYSCMWRYSVLSCFMDVWFVIVQNQNTHIFSLLQRLEYHTPMSFEQALAMGRTGILPSPVINGLKPKGGLSGGVQSGRHSDSDEEDWC